MFYTVSKVIKIIIYLFCIFFVNSEQCVISVDGWGFFIVYV